FDLRYDRLDEEVHRIAARLECQSRRLVRVRPVLLAVAGGDHAHAPHSTAGQEPAGPAELPQVLVGRVQELQERLELPLLHGGIELELPDSAALQVEPESFQGGLRRANVRTYPDEPVGLYAEREGQPLLKELGQGAVKPPNPGRRDLAPGRVQAQ